MQLLNFKRVLYLLKYLLESCKILIYMKPTYKPGITKTDISSNFSFTYILH